MLRFDLENVSATGCDLLTAQVSLVPRSWNSRLQCDAIQNVMPYKPTLPSHTNQHWPAIQSHCSHTDPGNRGTLHRLSYKQILASLRK